MWRDSATSSPGAQWRPSSSPREHVAQGPFFPSASLARALPHKQRVWVHGTGTGLRNPATHL